MSILRRFVQCIFQVLPHITLLAADASDLFIIPWFFSQAPAFLTLALYFWLIYRPDRLYLSVLFIQGGIHDIFVGDPIGLSNVMTVAGIISASYTRSLTFRHPFLKMWFGCAIMLLSLLLFKQVFALLLMKQPLVLLPMIINALMAMGLYPLMAMALHPLLFRFESAKK